MSKSLKIFPKISFIIPTLNSQNVLGKCLFSIKKQEYPFNKIEIIVVDGGSTDNTLKIAQKFKAKIASNSLKTAEAGKAVGIKNATGGFIALIDSDNILPSKFWLKKMINPLMKDEKLIGSEPWKFTYRPQAGFIERYSALIGANDPYAFILGIYDRKNYLNNKWTGLKIRTKNFKSYLEIKLEPGKPIPTIGANGSVLRTEFLKQNLRSNYLFDIDIISQVMNHQNKPLFFAKVKIGIIHTFCESSVKKFIRKQQRRLIDYYSYNSLRQYNWKQVNKHGILKFLIYTLLIIPVLFDTIRGFIHKPDKAWFFHPLACYLTLIIYSTNFIKNKLGILKSLNRDNWKQ